MKKRTKKNEKTVEKALTTVKWYDNIIHVAKESGRQEKQMNIENKIVTIKPVDSKEQLSCSSQYFK